MTDVDQLEEDIERLRADARALTERLEARFFGQRETVELLVTCLLAGGHALLEGAPGLGKTTLVHALADGVALGFRRIQCTPDLMPSDVLGTRVLDVADDGSRSFRFERGPVFTHVLLADEINRATPRTQSALLEAMQERQVTLHGTTHPLDDPFLVVATQNPIEMEGTYPLPEAQLDRFLFKLELALPPADELTRILTETTGTSHPVTGRVLTREDVLRMQQLVRQVPAPSTIVELVSQLVLATHPNSPHAPDSVRSYVRYGASPRGGQAILLGGKARALLAGRLHVAPEDVLALAAPAMRHRLILNYEGEAAGITPDRIVDDAVAAARSLCP